MRKIQLLFICIGITSAVFSQTLFTYGDEAVDISEFRRAYEKNRIPANNKEKAYREYLDLYIKFKLKVRAAFDLGLDTLPQLQYDMQSFRSQIVPSYLNNEKAVNQLINEAAERSQKDIRILHFYIPVPATMAANDTLSAYKSIAGIYAALSAGKTDYENIIAAQPGKATINELGYITTFTLPYEYENIVYQLKNGLCSKPYRAKNGWHVFKMTGERKAVGKWKIAQILFSVAPDATDTDKKLIESKADSVYQLLMKGEEFGKMARWFSDDKVTYGNGGEMAEFGSGKFNSSFETQVFKLAKDNEISKPFNTSYGYHIVKRISQSPVPPDKNDPALLFDLKRSIQDDARINIARELFEKEIFKQVKYKKLKNVPDADLFRFADSILANPASGTNKYAISKKEIFSVEKTILTGKDWLDFVLSYKGSLELYQNETNAALLEKYINGTVLEYYKNNLEDYNADFRYQMEEFKAGNVLFEIMERNIWGKASDDLPGLQKMYAENKDKYLWAVSADIILFNCTNKSVADEARAELVNGKDWKKITEERNNDIQADSGRFELSQLPVNITTMLKEGGVSEILVDTSNSYSSFIKLITRYEANKQRRFEDAKGFVVSDYQNMLEEKWITELKKKYTVKINETVFQSLLK